MSVDIDNKFQKLFKDVCSNIQQFPPESIQRGVILLSKGNMINQSSHSTFYDHLSARSRISQQKLKISTFELDDKVLLIDPTRKMLQPGEGCGFVIQHYLLRTMKQAKFIFVFDEAHTISPIKQFTNTMIFFSKLFKTKRGIQNLADACAFVILDCSVDFQTIKLRLYKDGVNEPNFIAPDNREIVYLCEQIFAKGNVHRISGFSQNNKIKKYIHKAPFLQFLKKIKYYDLQSLNAQNQLQFNTSLPISENYPQYQQSSNREVLKKVYENIFRSLFNNIDVFANKKGESIKQLPSNNQIRKKNQDQIVKTVATYGEPALVKLISLLQWNMERKMKSNSINNKPQSLRLMLFLKDYLEAIYKISLITDFNEEITFNAQTIVASLFDNGYLQNREIQQFLLSHKHFQRCFPNLIISRNGKDKISQSNLLHQESINFDFISRNNIESFNSIIYILIFRFIDFLNEDIERKIFLPYDIYLEFFANIFQRVQNMQYRCFSNRMIKKLKKCHAEVAYEKAKKSQDPKDWLNFNILSIQSQLIEQEKREQALMAMGMELEKKTEWRLALKVYEQVSAFKSHRNIIAIYQKRFKFSPQIMKYTKERQLIDNLSDFINYCHFLMKIGFNEKVREICFEGLRLSNNPNLKQNLQNLLINARGDNYKSLHHKFLEEVIIDKSPIKYDMNLFNEIENKFTN